MAGVKHRRQRTLGQPAQILDTPQAMPLAHRHKLLVLDHAIVTTPATPAAMPRPDDVATFGLLEQVLDELVESGTLPADRRPGAEMLCWAAVHGFAHLVVRGPLRHVPADARDEALASMLDQIDAGLR